MYGVNMDTIKRYNVRSVKTFRGVTKDDKEYSIESTDSEPIFAYWSRVCQNLPPLLKNRFRYSGNLHEGYTFGIEQLPQRGDLLFITGGEKDVLSLAAHGFNAICFNSETANIPKKIIRRFSFRFKHIVLLYDMDQTGIKSMNTMRERLKSLM